jgi:lysophospholipase L1-like esterase
MSRFALLVGLFFAATIALAADNPATKAAPRTDANWKKRHAAFVERSKQGNCDVLFVGDSITQGWEGAGKDVWKEAFASWKPVNIGIGGDQTQHVLWRITEGKELEGIDPKVVVIMIGTNNAGRDSAEQIAEGVEAIVKSFRSQKPKAKILLLGVFPRRGIDPKNFKEKDIAGANEQNKKIPAINAIIAKLDDGKNVKYLDIGKVFLNDAGGLPKSVMPDYLHLSKEGYARWAKAIQAPVEDLLSMK